MSKFTKIILINKQGHRGLGDNGPVSPPLVRGGDRGVRQERREPVPNSIRELGVRQINN